jgi:hypothetical protein
LRRLAIFWLLCAATGFAAAASMAVLLSMAIDHRMAWPGPSLPPFAGLLQHLQPHRHGTWQAEIGN